MTSAVLFNIVHSLVEEGLFKSFWRGERPSERERIPDSKAPGRVRLVIDDWSDVLNGYPEIREDPLFLPFLAFYLKRRGITSLVIDTQPGRLNHILSHETDRELRALVPYHLYTWHVTFYAEQRVAITALPPISNEKMVVVRELKPSDGHEETLIVDPHFEYYYGFGGDSPPRPVPLRVRLYHEDRCRTDYFRDVTALFQRLYGHVENLGEPLEASSAGPSDAGHQTEPDVEQSTAAQREPQGNVIQLERSANYDSLRDFAYLQGKSALENTLVVQVDEFWSPEGESLHDMRSYFEATTFDEFGAGDPMEDPFRLFQATELDPVRGESRAIRRWDCFVTMGYQLPGATSPGDQSPDKAARAARVSPSASARHDPPLFDARPAHVFDRVPYTLDFGLLLADQARWTLVFDKEVGPENDKRLKIRQIWNALCVPASGAPKQRLEVISWRHFFEACQAVAENTASRHKPGEPVSERTVLPFDVDLCTIETLSCLVLEIWASEIYKLDHDVDRFFPATRDQAARAGLVELIGEPESIYRRALFRAWLLLNAVVAPEQFEHDDSRLLRPGPWPNAVACRHWYSTACPMASQNEARQLAPLRLPGHFTTRGDWFLGVASGSRSRRLGERAIDLLTSRRANITRMLLGLGLPVRGFASSITGERRTSDAEFRSRLRTYDDQEHPRRLRLQDLLRLSGITTLDLLAASHQNEDAPDLSVATNAIDFRHLWRSRLRAYDRHARIWSRWLIFAFDSMRHPDAPNKQKLDGGPDLFTLYDSLDRWVVEYDDRKEEAPQFFFFDRLCDDLSAALGARRPARDPLGES